MRPETTVKLMLKSFKIQASANPWHDHQPLMMLWIGESLDFKRFNINFTVVSGII